MKEVHEKLRQIAEKELASSAHNMEHVLRVRDLCVHLAKGETEVDWDILEAAVLLHDIARIKEDEDNSGNIDHAILGAAMAKNILKETGYTDSKIEKVVQCISRHRFRSGNEPKTIEEKILFDADKLDVLGAVGVARLFMVAGEYNEKIYEDMPLDRYIAENFVGGKINGRIRSTSKHSPNLEFETKIINIPGKLYTKKAKDIAKERLEYMREFFERLRKEVHGEL